MRKPRLLPHLLIAGLCALYSGCRSCDAVEDQLRMRETELRDARDELCRTRAYSAAMQRELSAIRHVGPGTITPELASQTYTLRSIALGRQTGGIDQDSIPGDEALQVVIEPLDPDNHAIKAPGTALINALEITAEGVKKPLSTWQVTPDEMRKTWRTGLLTNGYFLVLPWKMYPSTEKLRVVVQFTLEDGRMFEAEKDVTVKLVPAAQRKPVFIEPPMGPTIETPLPMPRKAEGPVLDGVKNHKTRPSGKSEPAVQTSYWWQVPPPPQPAAEILAPIPR